MLFLAMLSLLLLMTMCVLPTSPPPSCSVVPSDGNDIDDAVDESADDSDDGDDDIVVINCLSCCFTRSIARSTSRSQPDDETDMKNNKT